MYNMDQHTEQRLPQLLIFKFEERVHKIDTKCLKHYRKSVLYISGILGQMQFRYAIWDT